VRGFILASGCSKVYCAGLDLMAVHNPKPEEISSFWTQLQTLWLKLYSTPLASVAAVSGSAPAAGCMLALSCDYRVMASGYQIGYNETKFGLVAPPFFIATLKNTVGQRQAELLTLKGTMVGTTDAVKIGMVDEEVQEADVMSAAEKNIISLISVNDKVVTANAPALATALQASYLPRDLCAPQALPG
jgi:3,2-trans-enoyl-CoA isomerase